MSLSMSRSAKLGLSLVAAAIATPLTAGAAGACMGMPAGNGYLHTTEYYSSMTGQEVVTVQASNWGSQGSVPFTVVHRYNGKVAATGSVTLSYGAGSTKVTGLSCGKYDLDYQHRDGTSDVVYFAVTDGGTC